MSSTLKILSIIVIGLLAANASAQKKKAKSFVVSKVIPASAEEVWAVVGEDYGRIAHSHPRIMSSEYINGSLAAGEGAERVCNFNEKGTQFLKEKMINYSPETMSFTNTIFQAGKFPVDPEYTQAIYKVEDVGDGMAKLTFDMQYRTKPAFMGGMMKNNFKKLINDYFIAIEHHIKTGEKVTRDNFKAIKKQYVTIEAFDLTADFLAQANF